MGNTARTFCCSRPSLRRRASAPGAGVVHHHVLKFGGVEAQHVRHRKVDARDVVDVDDACGHHHDVRDGGFGSSSLSNGGLCRLGGELGDPVHENLAAVRHGVVEVGCERGLFLQQLLGDGHVTLS